MIKNISKYIEDNQIISIVGPTSSGKSALALKLATNHAASQPTAKIHLLSADSRQVYQGLEQLTGADIPEGWHSQQLAEFSYPSYQHPNHLIYLHGISIISPTTDWSVAHFRRLFLEIQAQLNKEDRLIIVGGTGFYHLQAMNPAATITSTPDPTLRQELEHYTLTELQARLRAINPKKFQAMNHSDQCNPRRLIRAIELTETTNSSDTHSNQLVERSSNKAWPILHLTVDRETLITKITTRVKQRFVTAQNEISNFPRESNLLIKSISTITGFTELTQFLDGKINEQECIEQWVRAEVQYAKRQHTWWKKRSNLIEIKALD